MGENYFTNPALFVINVLFDLYILAVMLRFILQWLRADFRNPLAQVLVKVTNPPLKPLRRFIPGYGGIDFASIVLMVVLQLIALLLISLLQGSSTQAGVLFFLALAELLSLFINIFIFAIFVQVIISWVNPGSYSPATALLQSLTEPLLRPARNRIPAVAGLDLSPLVVLVVLQLAKMLLIPPITQLAAFVT